MATGSALNLSLLSRGVGEVKRNGTEKVDVILEPQDYFNFVESQQERTFYLPPLQPRYGFTTEPSAVSSRLSSKGSVHLPKTFTTRKGALLLFSEDMAHKTKQGTDGKRNKSMGGLHSSQDYALSPLTTSTDERDLKTVDDLAKSILAYGSFDDGGKMNLKFIQQKRRYDYDRQIRPGFSAKRYLSTWTKTWDDTVLEKVISKGYLTEKSLFYYNPLLPHLSRRLNDDLSHYPTPYKLMRSMLMSPGSLSGYTFYRVRPESQETDYIDLEPEEETVISKSKAKVSGTVKVATLTADGKLKEEVYGHLDRKEQAEVLTDLLVKGAVHYALEKQQEYVNKIIELSEEGSETRNVGKFDMRDAVESMLVSNDQKGVPGKILDTNNLPERDDRSQKSGSFKGNKLSSLKGRGHGEMGVTWQDDAASSSSSMGTGPAPLSAAGPPVLPPIGQTHTQLTTIGEASREHTQAYIPTVQKEDDEPDAWAGHRVVEKAIVDPAPSLKDSTADDRSRRAGTEKRRSRVSGLSFDVEGHVVGGQAFHSSSESVGGPGSTHSSALVPTLHKQQWKGSTQSLRSHGSRKASGSQIDNGEVGSNKGSIIFGPDGAIKVGETMKLSARGSEQSVHDVHDANLAPGLTDASDDSDGEAPDAWRKSTRVSSAGRRSKAGSIRKGSQQGSQAGSVTEQEIIDKLTSHATHIAESVLSQSESGNILEEDIRKAASLWMDTHPAREISRSQSVQDLPDTTVIQEVMRVQKRNSAGPTVAEYRDQIKGNLMTALAKATGLNQADIPADAEIDPELLEQLANNQLTPDDIEIVRDEESGRSFIRSRAKVIHEAMGGVEKGHIYQSAKMLDANTEGKAGSIPVDRSKTADIGQLDIVHYKPAEEIKEEEASSSEVGSKKGSSVHDKSTTKSLSKSGAGSVSAGVKSSRSGVSRDEQEAEDAQMALMELEQRVSPEKKSEADMSLVLSEKSEKSKVSEEKKKAPTPDKKGDFVVGKVQNKKELEELYYKPPEPPIPKEPAGKKGKKGAKAAGPGKKAEKGGKKGKAKAAKKKDEPEPETAVQSTPVKEPTPEPAKPKTPKPASPTVSERTESVKPVNSDDEEDFIIVRDETMTPEAAPEVNLNITTSIDEEEPEEEQMSATEADEDMSEADKLRMISNREARNAKRAAAAEKRRQEVERKRREREEQIKKEKEEFERQEKLKLELEEQRKRKEEERRLKQQEEEDEQAEQMKEELERQKRERQEQEKEKRRREEYARKLAEMKRKQEEEEKKRQEEVEQRRLEEEERLRVEAEMMAQMEEQERLEYERKKAEEEAERILQAELEKKRREEEAQRALEEARRLAEEMARRQAELEARLRFNRSLQLEANGLDHTQDITKAFVFSYFELLQWLGLDIPEFELLKLNQY